jgi:hypothetical protein
MVTVSQLFLFEYNDFVNNIKLIIIIYIIKYIYYMSVFYFK